jgi:glycerol-3-phosphate acyltransferase PlsX
VKIAVDAMGGDHAPQAVVEGALLAVKEYGTKIILVGRPEEIEPCLAKHPGWQEGIEIFPASEVVEMGESPSHAARRKKDSSIRRCADLVKSGEAAAMVSAGNTGAVMSTAKLILRMLPGIDRPAIATVMPTMNGFFVLTDVGANVDSQARHLFQFAIMGEVYSRVILGVARPKIGLLSIGEEEEKGNEVTKQTYGLLEKSPLNFVGNIEGKEIFAGKADVVVADGFTGNVALKTAESVAELIHSFLKQAILSSFLGKIGLLFLYGPFRKFKKRIDYAEYGGAPLLGVNGICIISHGRSSPVAMRNAIKLGAEYATRKVNLQIQEEIREFSASVASLPESNRETAPEA